MKAKHSMILLSGLLLLMIGIAWAQSSNTSPPTCPALSDEFLQGMLQPTAWVRADRNANTSRWEIDCKQMDAIANMPASYPANGTNAAANAVNIFPSRGRRRSGSNSNYVNTIPYKAPRDTNTYIKGMPYPGSNIESNVLPANAANAVQNVRPSSRRRPRP